MLKNNNKAVGSAYFNSDFYQFIILRSFYIYFERCSIFDLLWNEGETAAIVFVGKIGWEVDSLVKEIRANKMFGNRLFWLDTCSDEFLIEIYKGASGLLVSSFAEGYSLPIVESQNFGMPVFARDIPVFREIGRVYENITYYKEGKPEDVARQFLKWKSSLEARNYHEKKGSKTIQLQLLNLFHPQTHKTLAIYETQSLLIQTQLSYMVKNLIMLLLL